MNKTFFLFFCLFIAAVNGQIVWADDKTDNNTSKLYLLEPYIKVGNIDFETGETMQGTHKSLIAAGFNATYKPGRLGYLLSLEKWALTEPADEDLNVFHDGFKLGLATEITIKEFDRGYSFVTGGVNYKFLQREPQTDDTFHEVTLFEGSFGGGGVFPIGHNLSLVLQGMFHYPFYINPDSDENPDGELGFDILAGLEWNSARFLIFFERTDLSQPNYRSNLIGVRISYLFGA